MSACFSVLGVAGLSPGRTSYPKSCLRKKNHTGANFLSNIGRVVLPQACDKRKRTTEKRKKESSLRHAHDRRAPGRALGRCAPIRALARRAPWCAPRSALYVSVLGVLCVLWMSCGCGCWCPRRPVDVDVCVLGELWQTDRKIVERNEGKTNEKLSAESVLLAWIWTFVVDLDFLAVDLDFLAVDLDFLLAVDPRLVCIMLYSS